MTDALALIDEWGPEKVVVVSHRRTGMRGALVIDNTARGVGKGGTRMSPTLTVREVARLARNMTWKWAAVDLFHGGAKASIVCDPASSDKEAVLRAFARALSNEVPREYVLGLDMGLTEDDAAVVQDELGDRGAAVGTPAHLGGVAYDQLGITGFGVAAARRFVELGACVVAVSTARGALCAPEGFDLERLLTAHAELGDDLVADGTLGARLDAGTELTVDCDIAVPAAIQDTVDETLADQIKARLVVEGANLPTSPRAQALLATRGVAVVPDFLANAGGVVAAAFAMDSRYSGFRPESAAIFDSVSTRLRTGTKHTLLEADRRRCTPHEAGRALAQERVLLAMRSKGRLPASV